MNTNQFMSFLAHFATRCRLESFSDMQQFVMKMLNGRVFAVWVAGCDMECSIIP
jgi:hypothetical protein